MPDQPAPDLYESEKQRTIRVFISSTFRDMHAERDELMLFVFPELRKKCRERQVEFVEVDLRWGITEEESKQGRVLPICLEEIKRCKPYFIGLLGERYGWVPDTIPQELIEQEPWLNEHLGKTGKSVTELEILHGVLNNPDMAEHAFFYFRDPAYIKTIPPEKIKDFTAENAEGAEKLRKLNLALLSDKEIIQIVRQITNFQHYHHVYGALANGVVLDGRNHLSNKIREELRQGLGYPKNFENYWSLLTQVTKMSLRQHKDYDMARLAKRVSRLSDAAIQACLKKLHSKYCWLDYYNMGPAASLNKFKQELKEAKQDNKNLNLPSQLASVKAKQKRLISKLKLSKRLKFLVALSRHIIRQKGYRKDMQYHGFYCYENLWRELARRKKVLDRHK